MSNSRNHNVDGRSDNRRQRTLPPPITRGQDPDYFNTTNVVRHISGGNNDNINNIIPPRLTRHISGGNNDNINNIIPPRLTRNINDPINLNINNVAIPGYGLYTHITDDRRDIAKSSETTIEGELEKRNRRRNELRRNELRRNELRRNGMNRVIDNFRGLSESIGGNLQIPIQGISRGDSNLSTVSEGEQNNGNNQEVNV